MLQSVLDTVLGTIRDMDPVVRTLAAALAIMLETSILIGLVVPGDSIVLVASTGVTGPWEWVGMILAVVAGALCGESIGFLLGRLFGPRIRHSRLGRRLGEDRWRIAEHFVERRGGIAVFASRFLPVLHSLVPLTVGMSRMSYRTFIAWTLPACLLWATAYVSVAATAALSYEELSRSLHRAGYVFVAILVVFVIVVWAGKKLLQRALHHELRDPGKRHGRTGEIEVVTEAEDAPADDARPAAADASDGADDRDDLEHAAADEPDVADGPKDRDGSRAGDDADGRRTAQDRDDADAGRGRRHDR